MGFRKIQAKIKYLNFMKFQLIIPMSGIGKRFQEAGYKKPKPLIAKSKAPSVCLRGP